MAAELYSMGEYIFSLSVSGFSDVPKKIYI